MNAEKNKTHLREKNQYSKSSNMARRQQQMIEKEECPDTNSEEKQRKFMTVFLLLDKDLNFSPQ